MWDDHEHVPSTLQSVAADLEIQPAGADDAETIAALRSAAVAVLVGSPAGTRARLADAETAGRWLATWRGQPAGYAMTRLPHQGAARITLVVHPDQVRHGIGTALLRIAEARVLEDGATMAHSVAHEAGGQGFAVAAAYEVGREHRFAEVDLGVVPEPPDAPAGVVLRSLSEVDPHAIWVLQETVAPDDPSGLSISQPFDTWYAEDWAFPDHASDLGVAAVVDGEPVAFTHVFADRDRGVIWSAMTGVLPSHRGRGLARLVKAHSLVAARSAGMYRAATANDAANAPMVAVNTWLGYRAAAQAWAVQRQIGAGGLRH